MPSTVEIDPRRLHSLVRQRAASALRRRLQLQANEDFLISAPPPPLAQKFLRRIGWRPQPFSVPVRIVSRRKTNDGRQCFVVELDTLTLAETLERRIASLDRKLRPYRFFSDTEPAVMQLNRLFPAWLLLLERVHATVILNRLTPGRPTAKRDRLAKQLLNHIYRLFQALTAQERLSVRRIEKTDGKRSSAGFQRLRKSPNRSEAIGMDGGPHTESGTPAPRSFRAKRPQAAATRL